MIRANWPGLGFRLRGVMFGGNLTNGLMAGVSYCNANNAPSNANWNYGASLSYWQGTKTL
jgi:hypothetical protein